MQHMQESDYREFKSRIVYNALKQAGFLNPEPNNIIFLPPASRRRVEFKFLKENGVYSLAYLGSHSHNKVAIKTCLILTPELQKTLPLLPGLLGQLAFARSIGSISLTTANSGAEMVISLSENIKPPTQEIAKAGLKKLADALKFTRINLTGSNYDSIASLENGDLTMHLGAIDMALPHNAFLQASAQAQQLLIEFILKNAGGIKHVSDLFCGIGTYSVPLAEKSQLVAIDDHPEMITNLAQAAKTHKLSITTQRRNLFTKPLTAHELKTFGAVVINPPRSGAKAQCEELAASAVKCVVMVSCNPATFARDARILKNAGFTLKDTLAIDQFVWSPHLEIAASFVRL